MARQPKSVRLPYPIAGIDDRVMELDPARPTARYLDNINIKAGKLESRRGKSIMASATTGTVLTDAVVHYDEDVLANQVLYKRKNGASYALYYNDISDGSTSTYASFALTSASKLVGTRISAAGANRTVVATGSSAPFVWDGSTASPYTTSAGTWQLTGTDAATVCSSAITGVFVYGGHIFFYGSALTKLFSLPVASVAGAVTTTDFAQFTRSKGVAGAGSFYTKVSQDTTLDGLAIVGTDGTVIVYAGSDPSTISTWAMQGTTKLSGKPLNARSVVSTGRDVFVLTDTGLYSVARQLAFITEAISAPISQVFDERVTSAAELAYDSANARIIINLGDVDASAVSQLIYHIDSNAWTTWSACSANTVAAAGSSLVAMNDNVIWYLDHDYSDETSSGVFADVVSTIEWSHSSFGNGARKRWIKVAPQFRAYGTITQQVGMISDFETQNRLAAAGTWSGQNISWAQLAGLTWAQWAAAGWASDELSPLSWKALTGVGTAGALTLTAGTGMAPIKFVSCLVVYEQTNSLL